MLADTAAAAASSLAYTRGGRSSSYWERPFRRALLGRGGDGGRGMGGGGGRGDGGGRGRGGG